MSKHQSQWSDRNLSVNNKKPRENLQNWYSCCVLNYEKMNYGKMFQVLKEENNAFEVWKAFDKMSTAEVITICYDGHVTCNRICM